MKNFAIPSVAVRRLVKNVAQKRDPDGSIIPSVETITATWIKTCGMASAMGSENQTCNIIITSCSHVVRDFESEAKTRYNF